MHDSKSSWTVKKSVVLTIFDLGQAMSHVRVESWHVERKKKLEPTNHNSASGKNSAALTSRQVKTKDIEIKQLFSLEMALAFHENGFTIQKPY